MVEEEGIILNGGVNGDEEGNWTYTEGRGESVINYVLVEEVSREEAVSLEIKDYMESNHQPLVVKLRGREGRKRSGKKGGIRN